MKKIILSLVALLATAGTAMAQNPVITVEDVAIENGKGTVVVKFQFDKDDYYGNFQMDFLFPEGITATTSGRNSVKADATSMDGFSLSGSTTTLDQEKDAKDKNYGKTVTRFAAVNTDGYALIGTSGTLFSFPITVAETVTGPVTCTLNNITISPAIKYSDDKPTGDDKLQLTAPDVTFSLTGITTGISAIGAEQSQAPAYTLDGQRTAGAKRGIIIREGKKMVVK